MNFLGMILFMQQLSGELQMEYINLGGLILTGVLFGL